MAVKDNLPGPDDYYYYQEQMLILFTDKYVDGSFYHKEFISNLDKNEFPKIKSGKIILRINNVVEENFGPGIEMLKNKVPILQDKYAFTVVIFSLKDSSFSGPLLPRESTQSTFYGEIYRFLSRLIEWNMSNNIKTGARSTGIGEIDTFNLQEIVVRPPFGIPIKISATDLRDKNFFFEGSQIYEFI